MTPVIVYHKCTEVFNEELSIVKHLQGIVDDANSQEEILDSFSSYIEDQANNFYNIQNKKGRILVFKNNDENPWIEVKTAKKLKSNNLF